MILSVCPNPCVDVTSRVAGFCAGQMHRAVMQSVTYSGKGVNVAKGVRALGEDCAVSGFMFQESGAAFLADLNRFGLQSRFIDCPGAVRVNCKIVDENGTLTEVNGRGGAVSQERAQALLAFIRQSSRQFDTVVISGSLPPGVSDGFYGEMSGAVDASCQKIFDTEGQKLLSAIRCGAALVKPNLYELEQLAGVKLTSHKEILSAARPLLDHCRYVLVSLGRDGALITDGSKGYRATGPVVTTGSAVGAGDGMVAACAVALRHNAGIEEILHGAAAAGTASVLSDGTNMFTRADFDKIKAQIIIRPV